MFAGRSRASLFDRAKRLSFNQARRRAKVKCRREGKDWRMSKLLLISRLLILPGYFR